MEVITTPSVQGGSALLAGIAAATATVAAAVIKAGSTVLAIAEAGGVL